MQTEIFESIPHPKAEAIEEGANTTYETLEHDKPSSFFW